MSLFAWLGSLFDEPGNSCSTEINPASGLPMVDGCGGVDVAGNPYGTDFSSNHDTGSTFDSGMSFGSDSFSSFDSGISSSIDTGSSFGTGLNDW